MINTAVMILNWVFFGTFVFPEIVKHMVTFHKLFKAIDILYISLWDKMMFVCGMISVVYRQWLNSNVRYVGKNTYEISFFADGVISKIKVEKILPEIVDIQCEGTDESYMETAAPYVRYRALSWIPEKTATAYHMDGTTTTMVR